jgi:hypothetical protein
MPRPVNVRPAIMRRVAQQLAGIFNRRHVDLMRWREHWSPSLGYPPRGPAVPLPIGGCCGPARPLIASASVSGADARSPCRANSGSAAPAPDERRDRHHHRRVQGHGVPCPGPSWHEPAEVTGARRAGAALRTWQRLGHLKAHFCPPSGRLDSLIDARPSSASLSLDTAREGSKAMYITHH